MAAEQRTDRIEHLREVFFEAIEKEDPEDLIFIDETGTNLAMTPSHGRAPKGQRLYEARPVQRGRLYTVIGALSLQGLLTVMTVLGGTKTETFYAFVKYLLCKHLRPGHVVVMDNLPAHKSLQTRALIEETGAKVLFLPPYHPELNPIEMCWAKIKHIIKQNRPRSHDDIDISLAKAIPMIAEIDAQGWFQHCGYGYRTES